MYVSIHTYIHTYTRNHHFEIKLKTYKICGHQQMHNISLICRTNFSCPYLCMHVGLYIHTREPVAITLDAAAYDLRLP